jgi:hypothetical protein
MATVEEIKSGIEDASDADLQTYLSDDREGVKKAAQDEIERRSSEPPPNMDVDPRQDPGPERYEDKNMPEDNTPLTAEEVPLEDSRKDETTALASDAPTPSYGSAEEEE